jgi:hypothetical protein
VQVATDRISNRAVIVTYALIALVPALLAAILYGLVFGL